MLVRPDIVTSSRQRGNPVSSFTRAPAGRCRPDHTNRRSSPRSVSSRRQNANDVRAAYRRLAKTTHPDAGGSHEAFVALEKNYRAALAAVAS
jgi:curved DNA-binding protein CbpA